MLEVACGRADNGKNTFLSDFPSSEVVWDVRRRAKPQQMWIEWRRNLSSISEELLSLNLPKFLEFQLGQAGVSSRQSGRCVGFPPNLYLACWMKRIALIPARQLTLILLTWTIWRAPTNASKWRMGFNSAFKGLKRGLTVTQNSCRRYLQMMTNGLTCTT